MAPKMQSASYCAEPDCWVKKGFHWDEAILYAPCEHWKDAQTAFWNGPVFRIAPALEKSLSEQH